MICHIQMKETVNNAGRKKISMISPNKCSRDTRVCVGKLIKTDEFRYVLS